MLLWFENWQLSHSQKLSPLVEISLYPLQLIIKYLRSLIAFRQVFTVHVGNKKHTYTDLVCMALPIKVFNVIGDKQPVTFCPVCTHTLQL